VQSRADLVIVDVKRAIAWGFALWSVATVTFAAAGEHFVPLPDSAALIPLVVGWFALVASLMAAISIDYMRRTHLHGSAAGLAFGAVVAATGLILDAAMLLVAGLSFPGLDEERTRTVAAMMLIAYAVILVAPAATAAIAERRGASRSGRV
jgi:hypothetical protein